MGEGADTLPVVDMTGGSNDDATLSIAHYDVSRKMWCRTRYARQAGKPPFNPYVAVRKFAAELGLEDQPCLRRRLRR